MKCFKIDHQPREVRMSLWTPCPAPPRGPRWGGARWTRPPGPGFDPPAGARRPRPPRARAAPSLACTPSTGTTAPRFWRQQNKSVSLYIFKTYFTSSQIEQPFSYFFVLSETSEHYYLKMLFPSNVFACQWKMTIAVRNWHLSVNLIVLRTAEITKLQDKLSQWLMKLLTKPLDIQLLISVGMPDFVDFITI